MIYTKFDDFDFENKESSNYCNKMCFNFLFLITIIMSVMFGAILTLFMVLLLFGCLAKNESDLDGEI